MKKFYCPTIVFLLILGNVFSQNETKSLSFKTNCLYYYTDDSYLLESYLETIDSNQYNSALLSSKYLLDTSIISIANNNYLSFSTQKGKKGYYIKPLKEYGYSFAHYSSVGFFSDLNLYLISEAKAEEFGYILLSKATGNECFLAGFPAFSADGETIITCRLDSHNEDFGTIEILNIKNCKDLLAGLWSDTIFPIEACWKDNYTIFLKCLISEDNKSRNHYYKLLISN